MENAHAKESVECLAYFDVSETTGLTLDQVKRSQAKYGFNGEESVEASEKMFDCNVTMLGQINRTGHFEGEVERIPNVACLVVISWEQTSDLDSIMEEKQQLPYCISRL